MERTTATDGPRDMSKAEHAAPTPSQPTSARASRRSTSGAGPRRHSTGASPGTLPRSNIEPKPDATATTAELDTADELIVTHAPAIEALLLTVDRPLQAQRIAEALGLIATEDDDLSHPLLAQQSDDGDSSGGAKVGKRARRATPTDLVHRAIAHLNEHYQTTARAFRIEKLAGGYRVMTLPAHAKIIENYHGRRDRQSLSRAAIETLAIVAYKQPLTRATLEAIRGVACGEVLRSLTERRLITVAGRAEEVGRPLLYATTKQFLEVFGLSSPKDLPTIDELALHGGAENGAGNDAE